MQGDPQFSGLLGQQFQIHGTSNQHYAIISTPNVHLNALFTLRMDGRCTAELKERTACWSHNGNYFGSMALLMNPGAAVTVEKAQSMLQRAAQLMPNVPSFDDFTQHMAASTAVLQFTAGAMEAGLSVSYGGGELSTSAAWQAVVLSDDSFVFVYYPSTEAVLLLTSEWLFRVDNSDHFLNYRLATTADMDSRVKAYRAASPQLQQVMAASMPHGLLGQTWSGRVFANQRLKAVEGEVDDYVVDGAHDTQFMFSRFVAA